MLHALNINYPPCHKPSHHHSLLILNQPMSYQSPKPHPSYSQHFNTHKPHKPHHRHNVPHPCRSLLHPQNEKSLPRQRMHNQTIELQYHTRSVPHPCRSLPHPQNEKSLPRQRMHNQTIELQYHTRSVPHTCHSLLHPQRFRNNSSLVQPQKAKRVRAERTWIFEVYTPSGAAGQKARAHRPHPGATPASRPGAC